jgi:UDP-2,3-diacylglucosamine pyrophosphatase LpxH
VVLFLVSEISLTNIVRRFPNVRHTDNVLTMTDTYTRYRRWTKIRRLSSSTMFLLIRVVRHGLLTSRSWGVVIVGYMGCLGSIIASLVKKRLFAWLVVRCSCVVVNRV